MATQAAKPHKLSTLVVATPSSIEWATPPTDTSLDSDDAPRRYRTVSNVYDTTSVHDIEYNGLCLLVAEEPASIAQVLKEVCWKCAMEDEMQSIHGNDTWELASFPAGHRAIELKWVFKVKKDPEGNIVKHKARLVAKGYAQQQGVDFDEVSTPVAQMETVRLLVALAVHGGWEVHHMDVKSTFLNGELVEEV